MIAKLIIRILLTIDSHTSSFTRIWDKELMQAWVMTQSHKFCVLWYKADKDVYKRQPLASGANSYSLEENDQIYKELQEVARTNEGWERFLSLFILVMGFSFDLSYGKIKLIKFLRRLIMEKNRLFIIISAAVAILSSFLPWASLNAGAFGSYSWNGLRGDGWFVIILSLIHI